MARNGDKKGKVHLDNPPFKGRNARLEYVSVLGDGADDTPGPAPDAAKAAEAPAAADPAAPTVEPAPASPPAPAAAPPVAFDPIPKKPRARKAPAEAKPTPPAPPAPAAAEPTPEPRYKPRRS